MKTLKNIVTLISALSAGLLAGALLITIMFNVCNIFIHKDIVEQKDSFIESCNETASVYGVLASKDTDLSNEDIEEIDATMAVLPETIINYLDKKDISISISDSLTLKTALASLITGEGNANMGQTTSRSGVSYIELDKSYVSESLIHEVGHAVDKTVTLNPIEVVISFFKPMTRSDRAEFQAIYESEKSNFAGMYDAIDGESSSKYVTSTSSEYFAESFQRYFINGDELKAACPQTYLYMDTLVNTL